MSHYKRDIYEVETLFLETVKEWLEKELRPTYPDYPNSFREQYTFTKYSISTEEQHFLKAGPFLNIVRPLIKEEQADIEQLRKIYLLASDCLELVNKVQRLKDDLEIGNIKSQKGELAFVKEVVEEYHLFVDDSKTYLQINRCSVTAGQIVQNVDLHLQFFYVYDLKKELYRLLRSKVADKPFLNHYIGQENFINFEQMYDDALFYEVITTSLDNKIAVQQQREREKGFNMWLHHSKGWQFGDWHVYQTFLNRKVFLEFVTEFRDVFGSLDERIKAPELEKPDQENPSYHAKFYALYHWIKIEMGLQDARVFHKNESGYYPKKDIVAYAANKYPGCNAQSFYKELTGMMDMNNKTAIAKSFRRGYKEKIVFISGNDNQVITHLKDYPN